MRNSISSFYIIYSLRCQTVVSGFISSQEMDHTFAAQIHLLGRDEVFILNQSDSISWEEMYLPL